MALILLLMVTLSFALNGTSSGFCKKCCWCPSLLLIMALALLLMVPLFAKIVQLLLLKSPIYPDYNDTDATVNSASRKSRGKGRAHSVHDHCTRTLTEPPPSAPEQQAISSNSQ